MFYSIGSLVSDLSFSSSDTVVVVRQSHCTRLSLFQIMTHSFNHAPPLHGSFLAGKSACRSTYLNALARTPMAYSVPCNGGGECSTPLGSSVPFSVSVPFLCLCVCLSLCVFLCVSRLSGLSLVSLCRSVAISVSGFLAPGWIYADMVAHSTTTASRLYRLEARQYG